MKSNKKQQNLTVSDWLVEVRRRNGSLEWIKISGTSAKSAIYHARRNNFQTTGTVKEFILPRPRLTHGPGTSGEQSYHITKSGKAQVALPAKQGKIPQRTIHPESSSWYQHIHDKVQALSSAYNLAMHCQEIREVEYLTAETIWNWMGDGQVSQGGDSYSWESYVQVLDQFLLDNQINSAQRFADLMHFYKILPR